MRAGLDLGYLSWSLYRGFSLLGLALLLLCALAGSAFPQAGARGGQVIGPNGQSISGASIRWISPQGLVIGETLSDVSGAFSLPPVSAGNVILSVRAPGFAPIHRAMEAEDGRQSPLVITLSVAPLPQSVTVTAERGQALEQAEAAAVVSVVELRSGVTGPLPTVGNALEGQPGVLVQQTSYGQVSPFLRGLTGYQVLNLIDGVRFNNSTFRSGPNQYLAFVEPSQAETVEAMLGPSSTQYGSDSLGGTIQVLSRRARFATGEGWEWHGDLSAMAASADASGFLNGQLSVGNSRQSLLGGLTGRKLNDLRAGGAVDSRNVYRRFFGLDDSGIRDLLGNRQQDTGFTQQGMHARYALRPSDSENVSAWYQRSDMRNMRGYKDLLGGRGRMLADFSPQILDFFYGRYEKRNLRFLDSVTGTYSFNRQQDGTQTQTLRSSGTITDDRSEVRVHGYSGQATAHWRDRHRIAFGGEIYAESIDASRLLINPLTDARVPARALYPNGSHYRTNGLFFQDRVELFRNRLSAQAGIRYTSITASTFAERNIGPGGQNFGVADSAETFRDFTWNASLRWRVQREVAVYFLTGRGFRAPNMNDLGALGLNDLGYEIPVSQATAAGALLGNSAGESALSLGRRAETLGAENLLNYEVGLQLGSGRWSGRVQGYLSNLNDPIVRRTLLFPAANIPDALAGIPVAANAPTAAQAAQGVVSVSTPFDPQAVKAFVNDGASRYYGIDALTSLELSARWRLDANYSYLVGRDLNPNRNIRRLPPQQGRLALLYTPSGRRPWLQLAGRFAGAQTRLSGGDLDDERIGASRRRSDIADFFRGSRNAALLVPGADGIPGNADDLFLPTGETLRQIQDRVLPLGATIQGVTVANDGTRVPLYSSTAGWFAADILGGYPLTERMQLNFGVQNLFDANYRQHGSGIDMPGTNAFAGLSYSW
ncbi:MAG: TonB-dependent receptor [Bryobacterales bacterium]|nr:TonB-dependent receptor [Bryobacterales bacterium]